MDARLEHARDQLLEALQRLPAVVRAPTEDGRVEAIPTGAAEIAARIRSSWGDLGRPNRRPLVALVGLVNAGKSALGNELARVGPSGAFAEGCVRETAEPKLVRMDDRVDLLDLPGLGSVEADEDDEVVRGHLLRADLVLVVLAIDAPIGRVVYDFLRSDVLKRRRSQRVAIVLNKVDLWDALPPAHRARELDRYTRFLRDGDPAFGFPGVAGLFDDEVPILDASVRACRAGDHAAIGKIDALRAAIAEALADAQASAFARGREILDRAIDAIAPLVEVHDAAIDQIERGAERRDRAVSAVADALQSSMTSFVHRVHELDRACWDEFCALPVPSWVEKTFGTSGLDEKKRLHLDLRGRYTKILRAEFARISADLPRAVRGLLESALGPPVEVVTPEGPAVVSALAALAYLNWDIHDDISFLDRAVSADQVQSRTQSKLDDLVTAALEWSGEIVTPEAIDRAFARRFAAHLALLDVLGPFLQRLMAIAEAIDDEPDTAEADPRAARAGR